MIDFHTHILPGLDDGSQNIAMTEAMLLEEKRQGVNLVVATPHFYANRMSIDGFLENRAEALDKTECIRGTSDVSLPQVIAGAEVYYFEGMGRAKTISRLCVGKTRTILVELPFTQWDEEMIRDIEALIERQNLNVVLAHIERYFGFQKDRHVWNHMLTLPVTPQINGRSFLKSGGLFHSNNKRKFCMDFLKVHPRLIVGSDCHNVTSRSPNLRTAMAEIAETLGEEVLIGIDAAVQEALGQA